METTSVLGLDFVNSNTRRVVADFLVHLKSGKGLKTVVTPNPEQMVRAWRDQSFLACLQEADLRLPDGSGIVWASKQCLERIAGVDVVQGLIDQKSIKGSKVVIIGGFNYQNGQETIYPGVSRLKLGSDKSELYWCQGYQNIAKASENEEKAVKKFIGDYKPHIVLVALGAPWQEKWLMEHRAFLAKCNVRLAMVVGGAFDFLTGKVKRAPKKWQKWRLEWLWRLCQEPWRWRRQLALIEFVWRVKWDKKLR